MFQLKQDERGAIGSPSKGSFPWICFDVSHCFSEGLFQILHINLTGTNINISELEMEFRKSRDLVEWLILKNCTKEVVRPLLVLLRNSRMPL